MKKILFIFLLASCSPKLEPMKTDNQLKNELLKKSENHEAGKAVIMLVIACLVGYNLLK